MASKTYLRNKEAKKLVTGFTFSFFEMYVDFAPCSKGEIRSFLNAAWELYLLDPNPKLFIEKLQQFFDELLEQHKPVSQIGRYISKHLKK
jgi:hypothetical protein